MGRHCKVADSKMIWIWVFFYALKNVACGMSSYPLTWGSIISIQSCELIKKASVSTLCSLLWFIKLKKWSIICMSFTCITNTLIAYKLLKTNENHDFLNAKHSKEIWFTSFSSKCRGHWTLHDPVFRYHTKKIRHTSLLLKLLRMSHKESLYGVFWDSLVLNYILLSQSS